MAEPKLMQDTEIIGHQSLSIAGREVRFHFCDLNEAESLDLKDQFDGCILATSKSDINDKKTIERLSEKFPLIFSVAECALEESKAFYIGLQNSKNVFKWRQHSGVLDAGVFHFGSCQSNGWLSSLRCLDEALAEIGAKNVNMVCMQADIVHPDTPTGTLGTRSLNPRDQEARNNLRPGFSQVESTMNHLFPNSFNLNTISLRTLIEPPGYQINRFLFNYETSRPERLSVEQITSSMQKVSSEYPHIVNMCDLPLGSKAFAGAATSSVILGGPEYLIFRDSITDAHEGRPLSMLITQSYVDNVKGYCNSVIIGIRQLLSGGVVDFF